MNQCKRVSDCPEDRLAQCRGEAVQARCDALQGLLNKADQKISDLTHAAPVPPAGDVEVLAWIMQYQSIIPGMTGQKIVQLGNPEPCSGAITELVDRAHVTRLTAERDEEALWRKEAREGWGQATKVIEMQRAKLDEQEAELTKARELVRRMTNNYACCLEAGHDRITFLGGDCDSVEKMLDDNRDYAEACAFLANSIAHNVGESCGQDAEAAKGDDTHEGPWIVNGKEVSERPVCRVEGCSEFAESPWTNCREHWR